MNHFESIITQLDLNDIAFMNALYTNESFSKFQAISKTEIMEESKLSDFAFRKSIRQLETLLFVEVVTTSKKYRYFLTSFGLEAIYKIVERNDVECVTE